MLCQSLYHLTSYLQGFSISRIEGAYCDDGQNFKNLVGFVKGLGMHYF